MSSVTDPALLSTDLRDVAAAGALRPVLASALQSAPAAGAFHFMSDDRRPVTLQVLDGIDVSRSISERCTDPSAPRGLGKLLLTDGFRTVVALEHRPCPLLDAAAPGAKIVLRGDGTLRGRVLGPGGAVLLLDPATILEVKGSVPALVREHALQHAWLTHRLSGRPSAGGAAAGSPQGPLPDSLPTGEDENTFLHVASGPAAAGYTAAARPPRTTLGAAPVATAGPAPPAPPAPPVAGPSAERVWAVRARVEEVMSEVIVIANDALNGGGPGFQLLARLQDAGGAAITADLGTAFVQSLLGLEPAQYASLRSDGSRRAELVALAEAAEQRLQRMSFRYFQLYSSGPDAPPRVIAFADQPLS